MDDSLSSVLMLAVFCVLVYGLLELGKQDWRMALAIILVILGILLVITGAVQL